MHSESVVHAENELLDYGGLSVTFSQYSSLIYCPINSHSIVRVHPQDQDVFRE